MTEPTCVCCGRPTADGYACTACTRRTAGQLATIIDTTPAARDVAHGQARHGTAAGGSDEGRLPLNLGATQRLDAVQATLTGWVRHVAETRGGWPLTPLPDEDPIVMAAQWLTRHLEWLRHRREVDEALTDIGACARIVAGIARGPSERKYIGPCVTEIPVGTLADPERTTECGGNVYAQVLDTETGYCAETGYCHRCNTAVATDERREWLDSEVRQHAYRAAHIAEAYGLRANTIRVWASRGRLRSYWRTETGLTVEWVDPELDDTLTGKELEARLGEISDEIQARGGRLHYVGDVLDLAAADAARRAEEQAKRARRAAALTTP